MHPRDYASGSFPQLGGRIPVFVSVQLSIHHRRHQELDLCRGQHSQPIDLFDGSIVEKDVRIDKRAPHLRGRAIERSYLHVMGCPWTKKLDQASFGARIAIGHKFFGYRRNRSKLPVFIGAPCHLRTLSVSGRQEPRNSDQGLHCHAAVRRAAGYAGGCFCAKGRRL